MGRQKKGKSRCGDVVDHRWFFVGRCVHKYAAFVTPGTTHKNIQQRSRILEDTELLISWNDSKSHKLVCRNKTKTIIHFLCLLSHHPEAGLHLAVVFSSAEALGHRNKVKEYVFAL